MADVYPEIEYLQASAWQNSYCYKQIQREIGFGSIEAKYASVVPGIELPQGAAPLGPAPFAKPADVRVIAMPEAFVLAEVAKLADAKLSSERRASKSRGPEQGRGFSRGPGKGRGKGFGKSDDSGKEGGGKGPSSFYLGKNASARRRERSRPPHTDRRGPAQAPDDDVGGETTDPDAPMSDGDLRAELERRCPVQPNRVYFDSHADLAGTAAPGNADTAQPTARAAASPAGAGITQPTVQAAASSSGAGLIQPTALAAANPTGAGPVQLTAQAAANPTGGEATAPAAPAAIPVATMGTVVAGRAGEEPPPPPQRVANIYASSAASSAQEMLGSGWNQMPSLDQYRATINAQLKDQFIREELEQRRNLNRKSPRTAGASEPSVAGPGLAANPARSWYGQEGAARPDNVAAVSDPAVGKRLPLRSHPGIGAGPPSAYPRLKDHPRVALSPLGSEPAPAYIPCGGSAASSSAAHAPRGCAASSSSAVAMLPPAAVAGSAAASTAVAPAAAGTSSSSPIRKNARRGDSRGEGRRARQRELNPALEQAMAGRTPEEARLLADGIRVATEASTNALLAFLAQHGPAGENRPRSRSARGQEDTRYERYD